MIAGRYALLREVGRGGMGAVWLGHDEVLGRDVAMKQIGLVPGIDSPDLQRAAREAKLAASVNHPHIVAVYDLVHEDGRQWLVMEYVEGTDLGTYVRDHGALTVERSAQIVAQAADALAAAHAIGITHRDVKPSNIMLDEKGSAKITDFGIARAEQDAQLTQTGLLTGSPAYLAPEVASGRLALASADVWSLGATLFHMLEGRPPYDAKENVLGTLFEIVNDVPPRPRESGWLAPLVEGTLAKDPADRWTMAQVREFAARGTRPAPPGVGGHRSAAHPPSERTTTLPPLAPAPARHRSRPGVTTTLVGIAALALLLTLGLIWWLNHDPGPTAAPTPSDTSATSTTSQSSATTPPSTDMDADAMRTFVEQYLALVVKNPNRSWKLLTPTFQEASGGKKAYRDFWRDFEKATLSDLEADPATGEVHYHVAYVDREGGGFSDDPVLTLTRQDGRLLIAAER